MNYLIDIDGSITIQDVKNEEPWKMKVCDPVPGAIDKINQLYKEGHTVVFFTSRTDQHKEITERWLRQHGFHYHYVIYNKPRGGNYIWIDNLDVKYLNYPNDINWSD